MPLCSTNRQGSRSTKPGADVDKIASQLEEASAAGDGNAAYALGTWYLHGKEPAITVDLERAIELLVRAAKQNIPDACFDLAICYEKGIGVEQNFRFAFEFYVRAALHGDKQSVYEVGRCYFYGIGVAEDERLSETWFERASELGIDFDSGKPG